MSCGLVEFPRGAVERIAAALENLVLRAAAGVAERRIVIVEFHANFLDSVLRRAIGQAQSHVASGEPSIKSSLLCGKAGQLIPAGAAGVERMNEGRLKSSTRSRPSRVVPTSSACGRSRANR